MLLRTVVHNPVGICNASVASVVGSDECSNFGKVESHAAVDAYSSVYGVSVENVGIFNFVETGWCASRLSIELF